MCHIRHLSEAAPADRPELISLVEACVHHFVEFRGAGAGVANGSCGAVVRTGAGPQDFVFGSSQAFKLDAQAPAAANAKLFDPTNHAERVAWAAALRTAPQPASRHLYVELAPCVGPNGCATWAQQNLPQDMNVWFLYGSTELMQLAHKEGVQTELATLYTLWPAPANGH